MSGGSMNYLYRETPAQQLGLLRMYIDKIERTFAAALECKTIGYGEDERAVTPVEQAAAHQVLAEIGEIVAGVDVLAVRIATLEDVLQTVEWAYSGDTGPDSVLVAAEQWLSKKAGVASLVALIASAGNEEG